MSFLSEQFQMIMPLLEKERMLRRAEMVSFVLIMLLVATSLKSCAGASSQQQTEAFTIRMDVTYSNPHGGKNIWNFTEEDRTIGLFMNNAWQTVELLDVSLPLETTNLDEDGNPIAVLRLQKPGLKPGESLSFSATFQASSGPRLIPEISEGKSETLDKIPADLKKKYCSKADTWQVDNPDLRLLASSLIMRSETRPLTIVKDFIIWIKHNIGYFVNEVPSYPNETFASRKGDCDDQAILLVTLCRIVGIPAYLQVGCIYQPTRERTSETYWNGQVTDVLTQIAWHGWAVAYIPPWGFLPIDLTYVGNFSDPLNAIKAGAVTLRDTIQYMNVSQSDYIARTRRNKEFLEENSFYIFMEDYMSPISLQKGFWEEIADAWPYLVTIVVIAVLSLSFVYLRKVRRR